MPRFIFSYVFELLFAAVLVGLLYFSVWTEYKFIFSILVILAYWFSLRRIEGLILDENQKIYNKYSENAGQGRGWTQEYVEAKIEKERIPLRHALEQLELKRKFFVDKFVIVGLVLTVLLQF